MKDHLMKEDALKDVCLYCGKDMRETMWDAFHHRTKLYMSAQCECGKKAIVRLPHYGSGHGQWNNSVVLDEHKHGGKTTMRTLEAKIKIIGGK